MSLCVCKVMLTVVVSKQMWHCYGTLIFVSVAGNVSGSLALTVGSAIDECWCHCACGVQWVLDSRPQSRAAQVKVDANKFAPQGTNPNELRDKVLEVKDTLMSFLQHELSVKVSVLTFLLHIIVKLVSGLTVECCAMLHLDPQRIFH